MPRIVLDSTVLVSAFLTSGGAAFDLLNSEVEIFLSEDILAETGRVLKTSVRIRRKYAYSDDDVDEYLRGLEALAVIVKRIPKVKVVRDPADDMIIGCALAARADFLVSRDWDLLDMKSHGSFHIVTPGRHAPNASRCHFKVLAIRQALFPPLVQFAYERQPPFCPRSPTRPQALH
jgi:uncharacterized protein